MVEVGLLPMLQDDALPDLNLMYRLLSRVQVCGHCCLLMRFLTRQQGGLDSIRTAVAQYVEAVGKEMVTADTGDKKSKVRNSSSVFCFFVSNVSGWVIRTRTTSLFR
jgi:hypothetical protein